MDGRFLRFIGVIITTTMFVIVSGCAKQIKISEIPKQQQVGLLVAHHPYATLQKQGFMLFSDDAVRIDASDWGIDSLVEEIVYKHLVKSGYKIDLIIDQALKQAISEKKSIRQRIALAEEKAKERNLGALFVVIPDLAPVPKTRQYVHGYGIHYYEDSDAKGSYDLASTSYPTRIGQADLYYAASIWYMDITTKQKSSDYLNTWRPIYLKMTDHDKALVCQSYEVESKKRFPFYNDENPLPYLNEFLQRQHHRYGEFLALPDEEIAWVIQRLKNDIQIMLDHRLNELGLTKISIPKTFSE